MSAAVDARVALRTRSGFEATDLGFAMARAWWRPLAASWVTLVLPAGLTIAVLLRDRPSWSLAVLWWLRPAFARIPLHVLSQALFGRSTSAADVARALPRLLRSGLGTSLFAHRFLPSRTLLQPVLQLEGLRGRARSERCAVFARHDSAVAAALSFTIAHLNGALLFGLVLAVSLATPSETGWDVSSLVIGDAAIPAILPLLYLLGISVFEPLLVAAGFALYLNRRVFLEGWEIELAFHSLAARCATGAPRHRLAGAAACILLCSLLLSGSARADACMPGEPSSARDCITEVRADPAFGGVRKEMRWLPKKVHFGDRKAPEFEWLAPFLEFVARSAEVVLWVGLASVVAALLFSLRDFRYRDIRAPTAPTPRTFMGLDLDPARLPLDVAAAARACWERGDRIAALSLLYRGALVRLAERGVLEIPESATEQECLRLIRRARPGLTAAAFDALTGSWVRARYAHVTPGDAQFESLCAEFASLEAHG